jgi:hypothetical protein
VQVDDPSVVTVEVDPAVESGSSSSSSSSSSSLMTPFLLFLLFPRLWKHESGIRRSG